MKHRIAAATAVLAAFVVPLTSASAATRTSQSPLAVTPSAGTPATVFRIALGRRARTAALRRRSLRIEAAATPRAPGCIDGFRLRITGAATQRRTLALDPRRLGGRWCRAAYSGRIEVPGSGIIGTFAFEVPRPATAQPQPQVPGPQGSGAGSDTTRPAFAGLRSATTCTPAGQQPQTAAYTLAWDTATDDVTPDAQIVYAIYMATGPGLEDFSKPTWTTDPGATSFTTPALATTSKYYFVVEARDAAGNRDQNTVERAGVDSCRTDFSPPAFAGLESASTCQPGATQSPTETYTLRWQAATDNVTPSSEIVYDIFATTSPGTEDYSQPNWTSDPGATSFDATVLASGTYYFVVRARDAAGNEDQNTVERAGMDPCL